MRSRMSCPHENGLMHFEANQHVSTHQVVTLQSATGLEIENSSEKLKNYKVEGVNLKRNYRAFLILVDRYVSSFAVTYGPKIYNKSIVIKFSQLVLYLIVPKCLCTEK